MWLLFFGVAGLGTFVGHWLAPAQARRRRLRAARTLRPSAARDGEIVKLTGIVVAGPSVLRAPHSGLDCVAFELDQYSDGVLVPRRGCAPFSLLVEDTLVDVDVTGAETVLRSESDERDRASPQPRGGGLEVLEERLLVARATATVLGVARWQAARDVGATYRGAEKRLVLTPPAGGGVLVSNDPNVAADMPR